MKYDYLVVGSGLYGAVFAHEAKKKGKTYFIFLSVFPGFHPDLHL